jgi:L-lactate dehydrogenase complex protein LldE
MKVGFFITCLVDAMRPSIGFAAIRLLESAGCTVEVPLAQTCCGQPAHNSGDRATARALAEKMLSEFERFDHVVVPSGSCGGMIKAQYAELFAADPELSRRYAVMQPRVRELSDFLVNVLGIESVPGGALKGRVTYHDSCSGLRELGVKSQPRALIGRLPDVSLVEMAQCEQCCGFGGTFSVKYGEISGAIVDEKCGHIEASGADAVVLGDLGCMLNIEGRLRRRGNEHTKVIHIAELLAGEKF